MKTLLIGAILGIAATLGALRIAIQRGLILDQLMIEAERRKLEAERQMAEYATTVVP